MKQRLDLLLVERGLAPNRSRAQSMILAGQVLVSNRPATKPGESYDSTLPIRIKAAAAGEGRGDWVSRGALKLVAALERFGINPSQRVALDVGASTGGFTQVLLARGAAKVIALDVGHGQLDWRLRSDPRVLTVEHANARHFDFKAIPESTDVTLVVVDVSFISLVTVLPNLIASLPAVADWVTLIKPQFEVGPERVGKGGIVRDAGYRQAAVDAVTVGLEKLGLNRGGLIESPISGSKGNIEFLAHWKRA